MSYILIAIFLWSSLGLVIRLSGIPIHLLIFFSCVISSSITGIILLAQRLKGKTYKGKGFSYLLILGPLSLLNTFSFFYAYENTTIANAVLTHYTAPVLVAFLAPFFLKERLTIRVLLAVAIATSGLLIMFGVSLAQLQGFVSNGDKNTAGILAGIISGFTYAILVIIMRKLSLDFHPLVMAFSQNFVIAVILLPFAGIPANISTSFWALAVMGILHSTVATLLYFKGLKEVTANRAAILGYLEPPSAIILGGIFLGEAITLKTLIGGILILFSGYLTLRDS